jgi:hypothetical protein
MYNNQEFAVKESTNQFMDSLRHPKPVKITCRTITEAKRKKILKRLEGVINA